VHNHISDLERTLGDTKLFTDNNQVYTKPSAVWDQRFYVCSENTV